MSLTKEQQAVVDSQEQYNLVVAVPGSGKTHTMVERANSLDVNSRKLLVAFNKEAAMELDTRLSKMGCQNYKASTFHGYAYGWVMKNYTTFGYNVQPKVEPQPNYLEGIKSGLNPKAKGWADLNIDFDYFKELERSQYDYEIQRFLDNNTIDLSDSKTNIRRYRSFLAVKSWREYLKKNGIITFDTMIRSLAEKRFLLKNISYNHVFIDEFQDVSRFEMDIVTSIIRHNERNLESTTVVGDFRQTIYTFKGSSAESFNKLRRVQPFKDFVLSTNFRSKDSIIAYAETVYEAKMKGVRGDSPDAFFNLPIGSSDVVPLLKNPDLSKTAIICRYNRDIASFMLRLSNSRIPFFAVRSPGSKDFFELPHVKMIMGFKAKDMTYSQVQSNSSWIDFMSRPSIQDNPDYRNEIEHDLIWIMGLRMKDISQIKNVAQNPKGIKLSTVHMAKGKEFDWVFLYNTSSIKEREVHYVGCTRARDRLIIS